MTEKLLSSEKFLLAAWYPNNKDWLSGGDFQAYKQTVSKFTSSFFKSGLALGFIEEGGLPSGKEETWLKRRGDDIGEAGKVFWSLTSRIALLACIRGADIDARAKKHVVRSNLPPEVEPPARMLGRLMPCGRPVHVLLMIELRSAREIPDAPSVCLTLELFSDRGIAIDIFYTMENLLTSLLARSEEGRNVYSAGLASKIEESVEKRSISKDDLLKEICAEDLQRSYHALHWNCHTFVAHLVRVLLGTSLDCALRERWGDCRQESKVARVCDSIIRTNYVAV